MYVDLAGLARYKRDFDAWARSALLPKDAAAARVRTAKAGAVSFVPVQETPLDVSVDFLFAETPPASGDKGPDNPSTISGVSNINITRCGKNLMPVNMAREAVDWGVERHGIIANKISDAVISLTGKATQDTGINLLPRLHLPNGLTYTLSGADSDARINNVDNYWLVIWQSGSINAPYDRGNGSTFLKIRYDSYDMLPSIGIKKDWEFNNKILKIQIELGNQKTEFESPISNTYTIQLNDTYYGGTLDVATGVMTVTMQYMVADSNAEIIWIGTNFVAWRFPAGLNCIGRAIGTEVCSHFPFNGAWDGSFAHFYATPSSGLYLANPNWTASTYRQYFTDQYNNGTPVTACYQLANPFTVQLTPTEILSLTQPSVYDPRVNTVYSDAQAVQVGYLKHPSAASADLRNALVSLGGGV